MKAGRRSGLTSAAISDDGRIRRAKNEKRLESHKKRLEEFGEVNLLAISEHEELKERHDFLATQIKDLNSSLDTLQKTITRIDQISKKRFSETFEAVNHHFRNVFPRLFPGGKGSLCLTDEADMLETGVDIDMLIPGKKNRICLSCPEVKSPRRRRSDIRHTHAPPVTISDPRRGGRSP